MLNTNHHPGSETSVGLLAQARDLQQAHAAQLLSVFWRRAREAVRHALHLDSSPFLRHHTR